MIQTSAGSRADGNLMPKLKDLFTRYWLLMLAGLVFLIGQWPLLAIWWREYWGNTDSYYSHGVLVPFLAAIMVYLNKPRLQGAASAGSWVGPVLLLACIPLYMLGMLVKIQLLCGAAFLLSILGITMSLLGPRITRVLTVPILFLSTMIPFANYVLDTLTLRFQVASTTLATRAFSLLGYSVHQMGNTILSDSLPGPLLIGIPCSGLKLFVTLVMCCWFLVYIVEGSPYRKAFVLVLALPLSILANTLRVVMIGLVGFRTHSSEAVASFHDTSGYITLGLSAFVVYGVIYLLGMRDIRTVMPSADGSEAQLRDSSRARNGVLGVVTIVLLAVSAMAGWKANDVLNMPGGRLDRSAIPRSFGTWVSADEKIDAKTMQFLAKGDHLSRIYTDSTGREEPVLLFVTAGSDNRAFHDPLMCLSGGGGSIENIKTVRLALPVPRPITVRAKILRVVQDNGTVLVAYWYMRGRESWADTSQVQLMIKKETLMEGLRLMVNPLRLRDFNRRLEQNQIFWFRFATEMNDQNTSRRDLEEFIRGIVRNGLLNQAESQPE